MLAVLSFILLIVVTGGVIYLTLIEWRDKRRRGEAARAVPMRGSGGRGIAKGAKGKSAKGKGK